LLDMFEVHETPLLVVSTAVTALSRFVLSFSE